MSWRNIRRLNMLVFASLFLCSCILQIEDNLAEDGRYQKYLRSEIQTFVDALKDDNIQVRIHAAWALGEAVDPKSVAPLLQTLAHDSASAVRLQAALSLFKLHDYSGLPEIQKQWQTGTIDSQLMEQTAVFLATVEEAAFVGPLLELLSHKNQTLRKASLVALLDWVKAQPQKQDPSSKAYQKIQTLLPTLKSMQQNAEPLTLIYLRLILANLKQLDLKTTNTLQVAVQANLTEEIKRLIEHGFSPDSYIQFEKIDPFSRFLLQARHPRIKTVTGPLLHWTIQQKSWDLAFMLLEKGANPNLLDEQSESSLMIAASVENFDLLKMLIEKGAKVNYHLKDGRAAHHFAIRNYQHFFTQYLLENGAQVVPDNPFDQELFLFACTQQNLPIVILMLNSGFSVNFQSESGRTPLMAAVTSGDQETVKYLVQKGALLNTQDFEGNTALILAVFNHEKHLVEYFLTAGADSEQRNGNQLSALDIAKLYSPELTEILTPKAQKTP